MLTPATLVSYSPLAMSPTIPLNAKVPLEVEVRDPQEPGVGLGMYLRNELCHRNFAGFEKKYLMFDQVYWYFPMYFHAE